MSSTHDAHQLGKITTGSSSGKSHHTATAVGGVDQHLAVNDLVTKEKAGEDLGLVPAGPAAPGRPTKYSHGFFDPEIAGMRKVVIKIMVPFLVLTVLAMWATLPAFWGSFYHARDRSDLLSIPIFDFDTPTSLAATSSFPNTIPTLGQYVTSACLLNANGSSTGGSVRGTLGFWIPSDLTQYPDVPSIEQAVVDEKFWAAVIIAPLTTSGLHEARQTGSTSWVPQRSVYLIYNQARNENAAGSFIVPISQSVLGGATSAWSAISAATYLQSVAGNQTAINALISAPRTLTPGVGYTLTNLRNFAAAPTAPAATLVGSIFIVVFSFLVTMTFNAVREIIGPFLKLSHYIGLRLAIPAFCYMVLSLAISMINLPFKVPFDAHFSYGTGWFIWWMACWCAMLGLGYALEFLITVLTARFVAYGMIFLIIYQVSCVSLPHELQISFYHYGIGTPFNRLSNIFRTLALDTKNDLGLSFGVLLAWAALSGFITLPLITWFYRRRDLRALHKAQQATGKPTA